MSKESDKKALNEAKVLQGEGRVPEVETLLGLPVVRVDVGVFDLSQEMDLSAFSQKKERQFPGNSGLS